MATRTSLVFFILVFTLNHAENLNFYFSLHENRAINSFFIKSVYTQDVLSCGRACAAELNCNTANYLKAENKCDLSEERIENNSRQEPAATILKGCLLIEKVRINLYLSELAFVHQKQVHSNPRRMRTFVTVYKSEDNSTADMIISISRLDANLHGKCVCLINQN